jgi:predicted dehydrogenase
MSPAQRLLITTAARGAAGSAERVAALTAIMGPDRDVVYCGGSPTDGERRLPHPSSFGAIVVDGTPSGLEQSWLDDLSAAVEDGTCLLVIGPPDPARAEHTGDPGAARAWAGLLGVAAGPASPIGEWFVKPAFGAGPLARRLPDEFPVFDRLIGLEAICDAQAVLTVSAGFMERPVVLQRRCGSGRVVVAGTGNDTSALRHPEIRRLLGRALASPASLEAGERLLGLGIVGYGPYGGMGLYHGLATRAVPGLELVAACDGDAGRRKAAEDEFPGIRSYASAADLGADDDVELVVVATPPNSHFELALSLLRAGKHVALEKPMCLNLKDADALLEAARSSGRMLTVHQSRRWDPDFQTVRRYIERGELGEVFNVETFVGGFEHPCRAWHSEVSVSGGAVYDWGSHHLDWILLLMGAFPVTLTATGHKRVWHDITNLDQVRVRLGFEDGREAEFLQSDLAGFRRPKFYVQGTAGTIVGSYRQVVFERLEPGLGYVSEHAHHAEAPADLRLARYEAGYGVVESTLPPVAPERFGFHRNLADHLLLGEPLAVSPQSARQVVALLEAAQQSTDRGNVPVSLPRL